MTIRALYNKMVALDAEAIAVEAVSETVDEIRHYTLKQLLDGKNSKGGDLSSYLTDPYFRTPEAAQAYSRWKDQISPKSNRKSGIKNYYINGYYHKSIRVRMVGNKIVTESNTSIGKDIEAKERDIYGLNSQSKSEYIPKVLRPRFNQKMLKALGLQS